MPRDHNKYHIFTCPPVSLVPHHVNECGYFTVVPPICSSSEQPQKSKLKQQVTASLSHVRASHSLVFWTLLCLSSPVYRCQFQRSWGPKRTIGYVLRLEKAALEIPWKGVPLLPPTLSPKTEFPEACCVCLKGFQKSLALRNFEVLIGRVWRT